MTWSIRRRVLLSVVALTLGGSATLFDSLSSVRRPANPLPHPANSAPVVHARPVALLLQSTADGDTAATPRWPYTLTLAGLLAPILIFLIEQLNLLARQWRLAAVVEERAHLAHEIHDTLSQSFAGIGYQLQAIRNNVPPTASALQQQVDLAMELVRNSHEETRRSIASLRPATLGPVGLLPALRACAERIIQDGPVRVETECEDGEFAVPPVIKDTFFRIGQEAIANSVRHASPRAIRIRIHHAPDSISMTVQDDGAGFVASSDCAGFGLLGMRNRAARISAALSVTSTPGAGTQVTVTAPLHPRFNLLAWPKRLLLK